MRINPHRSIFESSPLGNFEQPGGKRHKLPFLHDCYYGVRTAFQHHPTDGDGLPLGGGGKPVEPGGPEESKPTTDTTKTSILDIINGPNYYDAAGQGCCRGIAKIAYYSFNPEELPSVSLAQSQQIIDHIKRVDIPEKSGIKVLFDFEGKLANQDIFPSWVEFIVNARQDSDLDHYSSEDSECEFVACGLPEHFETLFTLMNISAGYHFYPDKDTAIEKLTGN